MALKLPTYSSIPSPSPCSSHLFDPLSFSSSAPLFLSPVVRSSTIPLTANHILIPILPVTASRRSRWRLSPPLAVMFPENPVLSDVCASGITSLVALSCLRFWGEIGKRSIFKQNLIRKLVHISIGLVFMLCWPLFSSGLRGAIFAAAVPGLNIVRMLLLGLGVYQDEGTVKSMSRSGHPRELLKGPLFYASAITSACVLYWRTSPIGIAVICNLCAGDGIADILGRRLGRSKLPYNRNKSVEGSIAMVVAGFLASVGYMYYFSKFGYIEVRGGVIVKMLVIAIASGLVESIPISTKIDDNLTVPLTSIVMGTLLF